MSGRCGLRRVSRTDTREGSGCGELIGYNEVYKRSMKDPAGFWGEAAAAVHWDVPWRRVLDDSNPPFHRWFAGARLNTCFNCVDLHVLEGRGEQTAIIYDSPITGASSCLTYRELQSQVAKFAGVLTGLGVEKGDRVVIYMPMIPEALVAMLACARIGAVHSVVFGGFAAHELAAASTTRAEGDRVRFLRDRAQQV